MSGPLQYHIQWLDVNVLLFQLSQKTARDVSWSRSASHCKFVHLVLSAANSSFFLLYFNRRTLYFEGIFQRLVTLKFVG